MVRKGFTSGLTGTLKMKSGAWLAMCLASIALGAGLAFSLCSCGTQDEPATTQQEADEPVAQEEVDEPATQEQVDTTSDQSSGESMVGHSIAEIGGIVAPTDYSSGVAWVCAGSYGSGNAGRYQIDRDGKILFDANETDPEGEASHKGRIRIRASKNDESLVESSIPKRYYDGVSLVYVYPEEGNGYVGEEKHGNTLIDVDNNVVWSLDEEGKKEGERLFGEGAVVNIYGQELETFKGYFFVEYQLDTYEFTGKAIGVVDTRGKWVIEPVKDTKNAGSDWSDEPVVDRNWSCGYTDYFIVDYYTGEAKLFDDIYKERGLLDEDGEPTVGCDQLAEEIDTKNAKRIAKKGLELVDVEDDRGETYIDVFEDDGYKLVELTNDGGGEYLTIEDKSGNRMFKPIRNEPHNALTSGVLFYDGHYIDPKGKRLGSAEGDESGEFHEERAWLRCGGEYHCVGLDGNILF